jgi:hypothetical protein
MSSSLASCHGDGYAGSETYRGTAPFSEVETHTMKLWQQDRKFAKVMDIHSNARNVRINYGCHPLPTAIHQHQAKLGQIVATKMGYPQGQSCCMGGDIHYSYHSHGALSFLTELGGSGFQPPSSQRQQVIEETWPGFFEFFKLPISAQGHIFGGTSTSPGDGIEVTLKVEKVACAEANCIDHFTLGEHSSTSATGRYHLWLPAGLHEVTITTKDGSSKTVQITTSDEGNEQNIYLGDHQNSAVDTTATTASSEPHMLKNTNMKSPLDAAPLVQGFSTPLALPHS